MLSLSPPDPRNPMEGYATFVLSGSHNFCIAYIYNNTNIYIIKALSLFFVLQPFLDMPPHHLPTLFAEKQTKR